MKKPKFRHIYPFICSTCGKKRMSLVYTRRIGEKCQKCLKDDGVPGQMELSEVSIIQDNPDYHNINLNKKIKSVNIAERVAKKMIDRYKNNKVERLMIDGKIKKSDRQLEREEKITCVPFMRSYKGKHIKTGFNS